MITDEQIEEIQTQVGEAVTVERLGTGGKLSFTAGDKVINLKYPLSDDDLTRVQSFLGEKPKKKGRPKKSVADANEAI